MSVALALLPVKRTPSPAKVISGAMVTQPEATMSSPTTPSPSVSEDIVPERPILAVVRTAKAVPLEASVAAPVRLTNDEAVEPTNEVPEIVGVAATSSFVVLFHDRKVLARRSNPPGIRFAAPTVVGVSVTKTFWLSQDL